MMGLGGRKCRGRAIGDDLPRGLAGRHRSARLWMPGAVYIQIDGLAGGVDAQEGSAYEVWAWGCNSASEAIFCLVALRLSKCALTSDRT